MQGMLLLMTLITAGVVFLHVVLHVVSACCSI